MTLSFCDIRRRQQAVNCKDFSHKTKQDKNTRRTQTSAKASPVRIPNPDPESRSGSVSYPNIHLWESFHEDPTSFFPRCPPLPRHEQHFGKKFPYIATLKNHPKKSKNRRLSQFSQLFVIHIFICGKSIMKLQSVVFSEVANRQTDRQTDGQTDRRTVGQTPAKI